MQYLNLISCVLSSGGFFKQGYEKLTHLPEESIRDGKHPSMLPPEACGGPLQKSGYETRKSPAVICMLGELGVGCSNVKLKF